MVGTGQGETTGMPGRDARRLTPAAPDHARARPHLRLRAKLAVFAMTAVAAAVANVAFMTSAAAASTYSTTTTLTGTGTQSYSLTPNGVGSPQMGSVVIANPGPGTITGPVLTTQNSIDSSSMQSIVNAIAPAGSGTDEQRSLALFNWLQSHTYHEWEGDNDLPPNETANLLQVLDSYGYSHCEDHSRTMADLLSVAGIPNRVWHINSHFLAEAYYTTAATGTANWHILDADYKFTFLKQNGELASVADLLSDQTPILEAYDAAAYAVNNPPSLTTQLYNDYSQTTNPVAITGYYPATVQTQTPWTLRAGERLVLNWATGPLYHDAFHNVVPKHVGNSNLTYTPDLASSAALNGYASSTNLASLVQDGSTPDWHSATPGTPTSVVYKVTIPDIVVGLSINPTFSLGSGTDTASVDVSRDGQNWTNVYTSPAGSTGVLTPSISASSVVNSSSLPGLTTYYLRLGWLQATAGAPSTGLQALSTNTVFEQNPTLLPWLSRGANTVTYSDQTAGSHPVQITYNYTASSSVASPTVSTVSQTTTAAIANGNTYVTITVTPKSSTGGGIDSRIVSLSSSRGSVDTIYQDPDKNYWGSNSSTGYTNATTKTGTVIFFVRSTTAGTGTYTATTEGGVVLATTVTITWAPGYHFAVSAPAAPIAGVAFPVTITAEDAQNRTLTSYTGQQTLTWSGPSEASGGQLPAYPTNPVTFTNGVATASVTLYDAQATPLTATQGPITGTASLTVSPAATASLSVALPANATSGSALSGTVSAYDTWGNQATADGTALSAVCSDSLATCPSSVTLSGGSAAFSVTFNTPGQQSITLSGEGLSASGSTSVT
jgi:hypothetical protein